MQTGILNKDRRSPNLHLVFVKNAEASKTISKGAPCYFTMNGTDDGLAVKSPSSGSDSLAHGFFAGAPIESDLPAALGDQSEGNILAYGFHPALKIARATRAASTDSWSSSASISAGRHLFIDTVNDAFNASDNAVADSAAATTDGATVPEKAAFLGKAVLGESINSFAASASATSDTRTLMTAAAKGFLFAM